MVSLDSFNKTLQPAATANQQFSLPGDFDVFHIWTLIPALYVLFRFIRPLPAPLSAKIAIAGVMVVASEFHLITKLFTGNMFSPEIPKPLLLLTTGLFGMTVFMAVLLGRVRISTLRNENETFSQLNSITYIGVFLRLVTYSHLP